MLDAIPTFTTQHMPGVEQTLLAFVQQADCVLLLISSSFFATSLYHQVMESALAEQAKRDVPVVPLLARAFDWKESACGSLKALPDNELPIAEWEDDGDYHCSTWCRRFWQDDAGSRPLP